MLRSIFFVHFVVKRFITHVPIEVKFDDGSIHLYTSGSNMLIILPCRYERPSETHTAIMLSQRCWLCRTMTLRKNVVKWPRHFIKRINDFVDLLDIVVQWPRKFVVLKNCIINDLRVSIVDWRVDTVVETISTEMLPNFAKGDISMEQFWDGSGESYLVDPLVNTTQWLRTSLFKWIMERTSRYNDSVCSVSLKRRYAVSIHQHLDLGSHRLQEGIPISKLGGNLVAEGWY